MKANPSKYDLFICKTTIKIKQFSVANANNLNFERTC